jgi:hypothetical protein
MKPELELKLENLKVSGELVGWKVRNKLSKCFKNVWFVISLVSLGWIILAASIISGMRMKHETR